MCRWAVARLHHLVQHRGDRSEHRGPNGDSWLIVATMVEDPQYLNARFVTSSHFKEIPDDSPWKPTPRGWSGAISIEY